MSSARGIGQPGKNLRRGGMTRPSLVGDRGRNRSSNLNEGASKGELSTMSTIDTPMWLLYMDRRTK